MKEKSPKNTNNVRLDQLLANRGLADSRSQAESYIKLGLATVDGEVVNKPGRFVSQKSVVSITAGQKYVSRGGLKLASVAEALQLNFVNKNVLDIGSSTGGFSDYALRHGTSKIIAVDSGSDQLHPRLHNEPRIELYERTDIRDVKALSTKIDIVLIDVSFVSVRDILPHVIQLVPSSAQIIVMAKPQFEAMAEGQKSKGVIKNNSVRRQILKNFEQWAAQRFKILSKADSKVPGEKGNIERFYSLSILS